MNYKKAIIYCEAILYARGDIGRGLAACSSKPKGYLGGRGNDPTANQALANLNIVSSLKCYNQHGDVFFVRKPGEWVKVIDAALNSYKRDYGDRPYTTIYHRYARRYSVAQIMDKEGISKRLYQFRRTEFLSVLLTFAVQEGLIHLS